MAAIDFKFYTAAGDVAAFNRMMREIEQLAATRVLPIGMHARFDWLFGMVRQRRIEGCRVTIERMPDDKGGMQLHLEAAPILAELLKLLRSGAVTHQALDELLIAPLLPPRRKG
ncbi:MAG TPA: hypothetical protein VHQ39_06820 [Dongiaceae bacterium]|jgi:hypothetical protein|nr:hypothetical protein [Dongiaceae bacterium]